MKNIITNLLLFSLIGYFPLQAQLVVTPSSDVNALVNSLVGSGVTISNANLVCPTGAAGFFDATNANILTIDTGIILATGDINNALGPNNSSGETTVFSAPGDVDLADLIGSSVSFTNDACVLSFDFSANADSLFFSFQFASEEYEEFYCSTFNDVFGFLISGPNPNGGNYSNQNLAVVPGTNVPISINNVGPINNSDYPCNGQAFGQFYQSNAGGLDIEYDGLVIELVAGAAVVPGATYQFKIGIADVGDASLDSGVFLKGGSFSTSNPTDPCADFDAFLSVSCDSVGGQEVYVVNVNALGGSGNYTVSGDVTSLGQTIIPASALMDGSVDVLVEDVIEGCQKVLSLSAPDCGGEPVPTMGEWGLFLFGMIVLTLGAVFMFNLKTKEVAA